jgi:hypothetical protein
MNPAVIVVITEVPQLPFEITGAPEGNVIQQLSTYSADHSLDERMRKWDVRQGLDLSHIKNAQIGLPAMKLKQRVVVAAELLWQCGCTRLSADGVWRVPMRWMARMARSRIRPC